jgi:hypothetical protein
MFVGFAVREIESRDIDAGVYELSDAVGPIGCGPERGDDLGSARHSVILYEPRPLIVARCHPVRVSVLSTWQEPKPMSS